ncbi:EamA family transporter [Massilia sp. PWRC2]|uniref:EamA family transporter n=1 Tax=Massilia sp. PWRC2 TaxID=2804626 RepID=UPI003CF9C30A
MSAGDIGMALAVVTIWGGNFVVIKLGLRDLPPILFSALRFLFAALPLVLVIKPPRTSLHLVLIFGLFQFAIQFTLLFTGIKLGLPAGLASLVVQLQAFFTIGLAVLLLGERPRAAQLLGALVALAGMGVVAANLQARATLIGFALVVLAGLSWAVANIASKQMGKAGASRPGAAAAPVNALALMVWAALVATPPLLLASWLVEGEAAWRLAAHNFSWRTLGAVLFQSYPNTLLGFGIWSMLMRKYPTATIAPFSLLVPVAGMLSAALILGETLHGWAIGAGLLVLGGLALNQFGERWWAMLRR